MPGFCRLPYCRDRTHPSLTNVAPHNSISSLHFGTVAILLPASRSSFYEGDPDPVPSLAFKWMRIIYRCWKDGKPYDEAIYMQSLRRRGSLLAGVSGMPTGVGWKSVAGFQKLFENNA